MAQLVIRLLGAPGIVRDGVPIVVDTRKALALLAYLAITGRSHARQALAALLWPEYDDEHARGALRRTLSTLRTALGQSCLAVDRETIGLVPGPELWIDVAAFRARLAVCRTHGHPQAEVCPACLVPLAEAVALYEDDFLAGFTLRDSAAFDDWQRAQSENLQGELAEALEKLAHIRSDRGDLAAALLAARRWLALDPLREEPHRLVMRLYAWTDQRNAALHQYRECVRILEQELGVAPLAATTELYEAIKGNRLPAVPGVQPSGWPEKPEPAPVTGTQSPLPPGGTLPLTGRATHLTTLARAYERYAASGYFVALVGEAGIGKTRLAEELLAQARGRGAMAITVRCYEGEAGVAYGPVTDALRNALTQAPCVNRLAEVPSLWLAEVGRLLPELAVLCPDLPPALPADAPGGQSRLYEGLRQMLTLFCQGTTPNVVLFDDVHWADAATLDLLAYLVRRLHGQPLFIIATWRDAEGAIQPRLRRIAAEAQRMGRSMTLTLERLALADVLALVQGLASVPQDIAGRLFHETEGLPLLLAAYIETLTGGGSVEMHGDWPVPRNVADLMRTRLDDLDDIARQAVQAAAVIGRSFDLDTLQATGGRTAEEIVGAVEALAGRGIIRELARDAGVAPWYDFTHEKLRTLVYADLSLARRRLLHGRAAKWLSECSRIRRDLPAHAAQVGRHFRLAGQDSEAAACFALAGDHARGLYANAEALAHYRAALALGHPDPLRLHELAGDMHTLLGEYAAAIASYETAAAICEPDSPALTELERKLGNVHIRLGNWPSAEAHFEAALHSAGGAEDRVSAGRLLADWSLAAHAQGQAERASALAADALAAAEAAGDRRVAAQAHNILGILARHRGAFAEAAGHIERSLSIAGDIGDLSSRIAALNNLALVRADNGDPAQALAPAEQALALCVAAGDRHREAALRNSLADLLHAAGRDEEAMAQLKQAVVVFAEIGGVVEDAQPEVWKLTEW
jgi:DNA-binding SARP family transcriptional activator